jgi:hypothetical protein
VNQVAVTAAFPAPRTNVFSALHDISGDLSRIRINQTLGTDGTGDQGSGNFGTYPLYIGARGDTSLRFNGRLYALIGRGALSDAVDLANTEAYVNNRTRAY